MPLLKVGSEAPELSLPDHHGRRVRGPTTWPRLRGHTKRQEVVMRVAQQVQGVERSESRTRAASRNKVMPQGCSSGQTTCSCAFSNTCCGSGSTCGCPFGWAKCE